MDEQAAAEFLDGYRSAFESLDVAAISAGFTFPCQVIGQGKAVTVNSVANAEQWSASIARIVDAYRVLGVASASVASLQVVPVTSGCAQATVTWNLEDAHGGPVYSFTASYTLVDTDAGPRIAAIVHDETPKLMQALAHAGQGRPARRVERP
jgi:hypothetical protein